MTPIADMPASALAPYRDLPLADAAQREDVLIAEGAENVRWLLQSRLDVVSVLGKPTFAHVLAADVAARPIPPPFYEATPAEISAVVGYPFTRGVLACARRPHLPHLTELIAPWPQGPLRMVLMDGVHDHANVGATIRNARCFGLDAAILAGGSADPWFRKTVRVSVGHVFHLPLSQHADAAEAVAQLRTAGIHCLAAHRGPLSISLRDLKQLPERWCLVLGNEDRGPLPATLAACNACISIPMAAGVDSLNVAAAGAVLMYGLSSLPLSGSPGVRGSGSL